MGFDEKDRRLYVDGLSSLKLETYAENLLNAAEEMVMCEVNDRAKSRAKKLGFEQKFGDYNEKELAHHEKSIEFLDIAQNELNKAKELLGSDEKKKIEENLKGEKFTELKKAIDKGMKKALLEIDASEEELEQNLVIYEESWKDLENKKLDDIFSIAEKKLSKLRKLRLEGDRGRAKHSRAAWKDAFAWVLLFVGIAAAFALAITTGIVFPSWVYGAGYFGIVAWVDSQGC